MKVEKIINEIKKLNMRDSIQFYSELHKLRESKVLENENLRNELNIKLKEIGIEIFDEIDKNEWNHLHDCILHLTWDTIKYNANQEVLEKVFNNLPYDLEIEAYTFGMNDTCWREDFIEYYDGKYLLEINKEFIGLYDLEDIDNYIIEHNIDTNIDIVTKTKMKQ